MVWYEDENPNGITREDFEFALQLAENCEPEKPGKIAPKVGAVVVKNGKRIAWAHRNMTGSGDHAEFITLEQRAVDKIEFVDADLITTLEPCTEKRHGREKKACAEWIQLRRIRKVWIGTLDRNPGICGKAVVIFQNSGIKVGWFPDDLVPKILAQNEEFFDYIQSRIPQLSCDELEQRRNEIKDMIQAEIIAFRDQLKVLRTVMAKRRKDAIAILGDLAAMTPYNSGAEFGQHALDALKEALDFTMIMDINAVSEWVDLGFRYLPAHEIGCILFKGLDALRGTMSSKLKDLPDRYSVSVPGDPPSIGPAGRAFDTATKIDVANTDGWIGKAWVEFLMGDDMKALSTLESVWRQVSPPNERMSMLYKSVSRVLQSTNKTLYVKTWRRSKHFKVDGS